MTLILGLKHYRHKRENTNSFYRLSYYPLKFPVSYDLLVTVGHML